MTEKTLPIWKGESEMLKEIDLVKPIKEKALQVESKRAKQRLIQAGCAVKKLVEYLRLHAVAQNQRQATASREAVDSLPKCLKNEYPSIKPQSIQSSLPYKLACWKITR
jgi:hypothetical protein